MSLDQDEFFDQLLSDGLSENTADLYARTVARAHDWMSQRGHSLADVGVRTLLEYVREEVPRTRSSRGLIRWSLAHYWRVVDRHDPPTMAIPVPSAKRGSCRAFSKDDARLLAKAARAWDSGPEGFAVMVGLRTALRREEIAQLRWGDIDGDGILDVVGKGERTREVPWHPELVEMGAWWRRFDDFGGPMDPSTRPGDVWMFAGMDWSSQPHVSPTTVWTWTKKVAARAGLDPDLMATHRLRHTALAEMNDATEDLRTVQEIAGHARPETTAIYTRTTRERMWRAVNSVDY